MNKPVWTPIKIKLGDIIGWEHNPRLSNKAQAQRLIESEKRWGQPMAFAVSPLKDGKVFLYDGHQRFSSWLTVYGEDYEVDARQSDIFLTEDERLEFVVTMHAGATGSWDWQKLSSFPAPKLIEMGFDNDKLKDWNNNANNLKELLNSEKPEPVDAPAEIDRAAELQEKWQTATGQLWKLGDHRLLIGDCTVRENVDRLMGGERARLEFSDPPYEFETGGGGILKEAQHMKDIKAAGINEFDPASIELITDTAVFCCNKKLVPAYIELANKNKQAWDLCFYKKENTPPNFGGHLMTDTEYLPVIGKQSPNSGMEKNVYSKAYIGGLDEDHLVAWQKPIRLVEKFIKLFSSNGEIIIDRFACTGTTIIAAHNLNRLCYAMEISEKYGAVILERFATATGITPELVTE